jgi:hypothetical protein
MRMSKPCWLSFVDWLNGGAPGTLPATLRLTLGQVWLLTPLARQVAEALGPWLLLFTLTSNGPPVSRSSLAELIFVLVFVAGRDAILALLFGAGLGALGGFVGRAYTSGQATPVQPNQGPASPPPAQPPPPQSQP